MGKLIKLPKPAIQRIRVFDGKTVRTAVQKPRVYSEGKRRLNERLGNLENQEA